MITRLIHLWLVAMRREGHGRRILRVGCLLLLDAVRRLPLVTPHRWRSRMRSCARCPIFHRGTWRCRQGNLGCGCCVPVKFLFRHHTCWARENEIIGLGWPDSVT